jgi:hypothetical protein
MIGKFQIVHIAETAKAAHWPRFLQRANYKDCQDQHEALFVFGLYNSVMLLQTADAASL